MGTNHPPVAGVAYTVSLKCLECSDSSCPLCPFTVTHEAGTRGRRIRVNPTELPERDSRVLEFGTGEELST